MRRYNDSLMRTSVLRLAFFFGILAVLTVLERTWPRHAAPPDRLRRWPVNLGLGVLDVVCVRVLMPWLAVDVAMWVELRHWGLLHVVPVPAIARNVLAFVALDFVIYGQHRLMHRIPRLWRLHRAHHTDVVLDTSTGVRFHPLETLASLGIKMGAIVLIGAPPAIVILFEIVLNAFSLLTHANIDLPVRFERAVRLVFVTSDMHRIHHSVRREEHDSNFGFHLSCWDRLCGSYTAEPRASQATLPLGLTRFRDTAAQRLSAVLRQPFER